MNLFASFILRAMAVLVRDIVIHRLHSKKPDTEDGWMSYMSEVMSSVLFKLGGLVLKSESRWMGPGKRVTRAFWLKRQL